MTDKTEATLLSHLHHVGDLLAQDMAATFGDLDLVAVPGAPVITIQNNDQQLAVFKALHFVAQNIEYIALQPSPGTAEIAWLQMGYVAARALQQSRWANLFATVLESEYRHRSNNA